MKRFYEVWRKLKENEKTRMWTKKKWEVIGLEKKINTDRRYKEK